MEATTAKAATTTSSSAKTSAANAGAKEEEIIEPEPAPEPVAVEKLDVATLSKEELEHPYSKLLGPVLVKYDNASGTFYEVSTASVLGGKVAGLFFHAQVRGVGDRE